MICGTSTLELSGVSLDGNLNITCLRAHCTLLHCSSSLEGLHRKHLKLCVPKYVLQNPIRVRVKVWVLHPNFEGKVVAEAYAGINHKSRCLNDEQDLCKKGEQMISIIRVFYKDTPVMLKKDGRYPKHIAFLDQAEGLPNCHVLWGVCYIMQIPTMEEITRMMGNVTSAVRGRAPSIAAEQGQEDNKANPIGKKGQSLKATKDRDTTQPRNKIEKAPVLGKKLL